MLFLDKAEVLALHARALREFGGLPGLRDEGLLDSALHAPINRARYEEAGLAHCASAYAFHLTRNHPFNDGNKRVGAAASDLFLRINGYRFPVTNDEIVELFLALAAGTMSREELDRYFESRCVEAAPRR